MGASQGNWHESYLSIYSAWYWQILQFCQAGCEVSKALEEAGLGPTVSAQHASTITTLDFNLSVPSCQRLADGVADSGFSFHARFIQKIFDKIRSRSWEMRGGLSKMSIDFIVESSCNRHNYVLEHMVDLENCVRFYAFSFLEVYSHYTKYRSIIILI